MPEVNQYMVSPRELAELILKSANVREGRWFLVANFGFAPGNFGSSPAQLAPGVAVVLQGLGVQRETPELKIPPEIVVDAAKLHHERLEPSRRTKAST
jgi:hypothetical protein